MSDSEIDELDQAGSDVSDIENDDSDNDPLFDPVEAGRENRRKVSRRARKRGRPASASSSDSDLCDNDSDEEMTVPLSKLKLGKESNFTLYSFHNKIICG